MFPRNVKKYGNVSKSAVRSLLKKDDFARLLEGSDFRRRLNEAVSVFIRESYNLDSSIEFDVSINILDAIDRNTSKRKPAQPKNQQHVFAQRSSVDSYETQFSDSSLHQQSPVPQTYNAYTQYTAAPVGSYALSPVSQGGCYQQTIPYVYPAPYYSSVSTIPEVSTAQTGYTNLNVCTDPNCPQSPPQSSGETSCISTSNVGSERVDDAPRKRALFNFATRDFTLTELFQRLKVLEERAAQHRFGLDRAKVPRRLLTASEISRSEMQLVKVYIRTLNAADTDGLLRSDIDWFVKTGVVKHDYLSGGKQPERNFVIDNSAKSSKQTVVADGSAKLYGDDASKSEKLSVASVLPPRGRPSASEVTLQEMMPAVAVSQPVEPVAKPVEPVTKIHQPVKIDLPKVLPTVSHETENVVLSLGQFKVPPYHQIVFGPGLEISPDHLDYSSAENFFKSFVSTKLVEHHDETKEPNAAIVSQKILKINCSQSVKIALINMLETHLRRMDNYGRRMETDV